MVNITDEDMRGSPANRGAGHDLGVLIGETNNKGLPETNAKFSSDLYR